MKPIVLALVASLLAGPAVAWPDSYLGYLQVEAVLQTLNGDLLASSSATETLRRWCAEHHLATPAAIVARRLKDGDKPADADTRELLGAGPEVSVRYRHVQLMCGAHVLSEADNWYLPGALTFDMNRRLDTTDEPFGAVARPLGFHRRTLEARFLFKPLPEGWEMSAAAPHQRPRLLALPLYVLQHRAVLETEGGVPFSVVVETYTREVLSFEPAPAP